MFQPQFQITPQVLTALIAAERSHHTLASIAIPEPFDHLLQQRCLTALTYFSTQIEGNLLSLAQVASLVQQPRVQRRAHDEQEVLNYFSLLMRLPAWRKKYRSRLTPTLIRACHGEIQKKIVEGNLRGQFRTVQNAVYDARGGLAYLPPTPEDVAPLIDDLCHWANQASLHPVLAAAILHNQLVTIHPFVDGNGRTARAISLYWLLGHQWDLRRWVPIDRYYAQERPRYYAALQAVYPHNYYEGRHATDFTAWVEYYVEGLRCTLEETLQEVAEFQQRQIFLNARQQKIVHDAPGGAITPRYYAARFRISTRMASRDLRQLAQWGYLRPVGKGRSTQYLRNGDLE